MKMFDQYSVADFHGRFSAMFWFQ